ncbi:MAG: chalcone isomerase family protein [Bdellovibrionaceae bacterium]|nr:chalcone isomerase family protein [Pseudobdellovibrionaceae bacterium]
MKAVSIFLGLIVSASVASAELMTLTPGAKAISNVALSDAATVKVEGADVTLTNVGSGLRKKYLAIFGTSVYVAQVFAAQPEQFVKSNTGNAALESLQNQTVVAVRLDFVYNVSADKVYNAFFDALKENGVDMNEEKISGFLSYVQNGGDASNGSSMTFLMAKNADGTETLSYEDPADVVTTVVGASGFSQQILSMWLGKISSNDKGLKELKDQLTK